MSSVSPLPDARARALRLFVGVTLVVLVSVASGFVIGRAVWADRPPDRGDGWTDLSFGIAAVFLGFVVVGLVYLVGLVVAVRWAVLPGRRLAMYFAVLAADAVVVVGAFAVFRAADQGGFPGVGVVMAGGLVVAAVAGLGVLMEVVRPRTAGWFGAGTVACALAVVIVGGLRGDRLAADERAERYAATGAPLALVDGRDLVPPVDGWELAYVDQGWSGNRVTATFTVSSIDRGSTDRFMLVMERDPEPRACEGEREPSEDACIVVGRATPPDGDDHADGEILGERVTGDDGVTGYGTVWVDVPGGRWSVQGLGTSGPVDDADAVALLTSLEPVDVDTFTDAT